MSGEKVYVYPFAPEYEGAECALAELEFVPVTAESKKEMYARMASPEVPLYGINDWNDYFFDFSRLHPDQYRALVGAQREKGISTIPVQLGRSRMEYHSELPDVTTWPCAEEVLRMIRANPGEFRGTRGMGFYGITYMINRYCPLRHLLASGEDIGAEVWGWLPMNRHYGPGHAGRGFDRASEWFLSNPQWRRWRKNAGSADRGEVSYFFEEVRRERVDIFLEAAGIGAPALLVGTTRQVPMLLYHPEMVKAYYGKTGVNPQEIDASDGELYGDWIRWRADHFTEVLRMLREGLRTIEEESGREIPVAIRIPSQGLFYNMAQGLDVEVWLREGLVDQVQLNPLEDCGGRGQPRHYTLR